MTSEARLKFGRAWIGDPSVGLQPEIQSWANARQFSETQVETIEHLQAELVLKQEYIAGLKDEIGSGCAEITYQKEERLNAAAAYEHRSQEKDAEIQRLQSELDAAKEKVQRLIINLQASSAATNAALNNLVTEAKYHDMYNVAQRVVDQLGRDSGMLQVALAAEREEVRRVRGLAVEYEALEYGRELGGDQVPDDVAESRHRARLKEIGPVKEKPNV